MDFTELEPNTLERLFNSINTLKTEKKETQEYLYLLK